MPYPIRSAVPARTSAVSVSLRCGLGGVGFEPDGAEVVSTGEADVGVEGSGEAAQEGDGGLRTAFFDALDVVIGQVCAQGEFGDGQAEGGTDVVQGLAERQGLANRDPLGIIGRILRARPAGV